MKKIIAIITAFFLMASIAEAEGFLHPGILSTEYDLKRVKAAVEEGREPYVSGWDALCRNNYANYNWYPRAVDTVVRSGGSDDNIALLYIDVQRAWQCAVKWKIGGDERYAVTAAGIKDGAVTKAVRIELSSEEETAIPNLGECDAVRFLMWSGMEPMNVKREFLKSE